MYILFTELTLFCLYNFAGAIMQKNENKRNKRKASEVLPGIYIGNSVEESVKLVSRVYQKPERYDRRMYDSGVAKRENKVKLFNKKSTVKDPYTRDKLVLKKTEAKRLYGKDWKKHLAEADHLISLHSIYEKYKNTPFIKNEDIKKVANCKENFKIISRQQNNAKRDKSNDDFYRNTKYLQQKDIKITKKQRHQAIQDGKNAANKIQREMRLVQIENAFGEFHKAGEAAALVGATNVGMMSTVENIIAVINGDKTSGEAIDDILVTTGKMTAISYVTGGSVTVITECFSNSTSQLIRALGKSGVPGKVVAAVMETSGVLKSYFLGEITTEECIVELGETGISTVSGIYGGIAGQVLIPIPYLGAILGSMAGYYLGGIAFSTLSRQLKATNLAKERRIRIEKESNETIRIIREYREQFDEVAKIYLADHCKVFNESFENMTVALQLNDTDGFIHATNQITRKLGGKISCNTMEEFENLMKSPNPLVL